MNIKKQMGAVFLALIAACPAKAMEGHGAQLYHMFRLEADYGGSREGDRASWDLKGWMGGDVHKLWLKSEGDVVNDAVETAELWALYSRAVDTFWDVQAGVRVDTKPAAATYAVFGFNGLAPYFLETEAYVFLSNKGDVSARVRGEKDFLLTQKFILQPYAEAQLYAQDIPEQKIGAGVSSGQIGVQARYEITRAVAPYVDMRYERSLGETAVLAKRNSENTDNLIGAIGLRLMF